MDKQFYVFAYGTLKRGKHNHGFLRGQQYIGTYYTTKDYSLYVDGLPFLTQDEGAGCLGEVYKVDSKCLEALDWLEGHPDFYERKTIPVYDTEAGNMVEAFAYIYPGTLRGRLQPVREF